MPSPSNPETTWRQRRRWSIAAWLCCGLAAAAGSLAAPASDANGPCHAVHIVAVSPLAATLQLDLRAGDRLIRRRLDGRESPVCGGLDVMATEARANLGLDAALERERQGQRRWVGLPVGPALAELSAPDDATWSRFKQLKALAQVGQYQQAREGYLALAQAHPEAAADVLAGGLATLEGDLNFAAQVALVEELLAARAGRGDPAALSAAAELVKAKHLMNMRRLDEAAAIVARQQAQAGLPPLVRAMGLQVEGAVQFLGGRIDAAITRYEQAQALYAASAPLSMLRIASLSNLALMDAQRGQLDAALARYEDAIELGARSIPQTLVHARNLQGAGAAALTLHRHALATQRLTAAEALFAQLQRDGPEHRQVQVALAALLMNNGGAAQAEALLRTITARQPVGADGTISDRAALDARGMLAEAIALQGRSEEALALLRQLHDGWPERRGDSARADLETSQALVLATSGRWQEALDLADRARAAYLTLGRKGLLLWNLDVLRGRTLLDLGHLDAAGTVLTAVDAALATGAPQSLQRVLAQYELGRWRQARGEPAAALEHFDRALQLLEALRLQQEVAGELRKLWSARFADLYRAKLALEADGGDLVAAFRSYVRYRQADDRFGGQGRTALDQAGTGAETASEVAEVQAALQSDEALVAWISAPEALHVLVLGSGSALRHLRLPLPRQALDARLQAWHSQLGDPGAPGDGWLSAGQALDAALWQPVAALLPAGTHRIRLAADGPLQRLVFAALPDSSPSAPHGGTRSEPRFRGEQWTFSEQAAGLPRRDAVAPERPLALLALGDPAGAPLDRRARRDPFVLRRDGGLGPLPAARRESENAAGLFDPAAELLLGAAASPQALRTALPRTQRLHLATHAVVDPARAFDSWVALAGARPGEVQRLTAREIAGWRDAPPLVVLSACASADGADAGGAGVLGLTRAWQLAGAHAVVATRWAVADRPSATLMTAFWTRVHAGDDPATALAGAQRDWLAQARAGWLGRLGRRMSGADAQPEQPLHPFWWAGFVVLR